MLLDLTGPFGPKAAPTARRPSRFQNDATSSLKRLLKSTSPSFVDSKGKSAMWMRRAQMSSLSPMATSLDVRVFVGFLHTPNDLLMLLSWPKASWLDGLAYP